MNQATTRKISHSQLKAVGDTDDKPRTRRAPLEPKTMQDLGVVGQVREALKPRARLAALLGALLGGLAPLVSYVVAHYEIDPTVPLYKQVGSLLVLGCLLFSASKVYTWGRLAFQSSLEALGFVVLTEGTLVLSHTHWLGVTAAVFLVAINGISTGCTLAIHRRS
jgi:hypothetical protein